MSEGRAFDAVIGLGCALLLLAVLGILFGFAYVLFGIGHALMAK